MNFRANNMGGGGNSYYDNNKMGHSTVSKGYGYSNRNYGTGEEHNFGEIQYMLQNERKKFKEAKQKYEFDLDNQRKMRIEFENKLIKLKDEFSRKEVSISELEFKTNNLLHMNQDLAVENQRLKNQLARMQDLYGNKIHELETQLNMEGKNFQETTIHYNNQFQKFKKQGQEYVQQLTFEYQRKIKNLQQKYKLAENAKRDLGLENRKLNDILISNKLTFQQELRDVKNKARDQELKKVQYLNKSNDQKLKMVEDSKDMLAKKNNDIIRALQDKERVIGELEFQKNEEIDKLAQDNAELHQQMNQMNHLLGKLKSEISEKDNIIGRTYNQNDHEINAIRQQLEMKKQQNAQLAGSIRDLKQTFKDSEAEWERRRRDLIERSNINESEARKYKEQYQKICDLLKTKINDTINNVSYKK